MQFQAKWNIYTYEYKYIKRFFCSHWEISLHLIRNQLACYSKERTSQFRTESLRTSDRRQHTACPLSLRSARPEAVELRLDSSSLRVVRPRGTADTGSRASKSAVELESALMVMSETVKRSDVREKTFWVSEIIGNSIKKSLQEEKFDRKSLVHKPRHIQAYIGRY